MLEIFAVPEGVMPENWEVSPSSLQMLRPALYLVERISVPDDEEAVILEALRRTDVGILIPKAPDISGTGITAVWPERRAAGSARYALLAGPWAAAYPDYVEMFERSVGEALDEEDHTLLIVRTEIAGFGEDYE